MRTSGYGCRDSHGHPGWGGCERGRLKHCGGEQNRKVYLGRGLRGGRKQPVQARQGGAAASHGSGMKKDKESCPSQASTMGPALGNSIFRCMMRQDAHRKCRPGAVELGFGIQR
jgi:hypothetical protein